jgi:hypothetical protein
MISYNSLHNIVLPSLITQLYSISLIEAKINNWNHSLAYMYRYLLISLHVRSIVFVDVFSFFYWNISRYYSRTRPPPGPPKRFPPLGARLPIPVVLAHLLLHSSPVTCYHLLSP